MLEQYKIAIGIIAGLVPILTIWLTYQKIAKNNADALNKKIKVAIDEAKKESDLKIVQLESELKAVRTQIKELESSVEKDLTHIKTILNTEVSHLAERVESLREEMRIQHSQITQLLTKLLVK